MNRYGDDEYAVNLSKTVTYNANAKSSLWPMTFPELKFFDNAAYVPIPLL